MVEVYLLTTIKEGLRTVYLSKAVYYNNDNIFDNGYKLVISSYYRDLILLNGTSVFAHHGATVCLNKKESENLIKFLRSCE